MCGLPNLGVVVPTEPSGRRHSRKPGTLTPRSGLGTWTPRSRVGHSESAFRADDQMSSAGVGVRATAPYLPIFTGWPRRVTKPNDPLSTFCSAGLPAVQDAVARVTRRVVRTASTGA
jgi:hypothetical protein